MFLNNKYKKCYDDIINNAKQQNRIKNKNVYYESHHIIPKCMGGNNTLNNLVLLTNREHYICHWLLCKFTENENKTKMQFSFFQMCYSNSNGRRLPHQNSRGYAFAKRNILEAMKTRNKRQNYKHSEKTLQKIKETNKIPRIYVKHTLTDERKSVKKMNWIIGLNRDTLKLWIDIPKKLFKK